MKNITAFLVISVIALLIAVLALSRVYVGFSYDQHGLYLKLSYIFYSRSLIDTEKKDKRGKKTKKKGLKEEKSEKKLGKRDIIAIAKGSGKHIKAFLRKIRIDHLGGNIIAASDDAAKTAILYGKIAMLLGTVLPILENIFEIKEKNIRINVDYSRTKPQCHFYVAASVRLGSIIIFLFGILSAAIKVMYKDRSKEKDDIGRDLTSRTDDSKAA